MGPLTPCSAAYGPGGGTDLVVTNVNRMCFVAGHKTSPMSILRYITIIISAYLVYWWTTAYDNVIITYVLYFDCVS